MEDEFDFYGDIDDVEDNVKGIDGEVSSYTYTNLEYPCIIFKRNCEIPKHKLSIVANMVKSGDMLSKDTFLYFFQGNDMFKIGAISGIQIQGFLDLVGVNILEGYVDKDTRLVDSSLYSLSMSYI